MKVAVISGSARPKRLSHLVAEEILKRLQQKGIEAWMMDVKQLNLPLLNYTFSDHPNPDLKMVELRENLNSSNGFIIVSPEYNNNFSGALKNTMDYFYPEYARKAFGIVTVSAGKLGGISAAKSLQHYALTLRGIVSPILLLTPLVQKLFEGGKLTDDNYSQLMDDFLKEYLWLAKAIL
ncbi:NADPH-dependent FMN reductase [Xanthovirga aplysinae]|uniref:NADPH-dependent FMN reductase n=1 Tax=Xanthovirga aplysinae TaxID=2529853 RepID=UPI0012BC28C6|nr:NAD(P)H-dependent oxidoreductase [Xanthovirga aplysinae]MTI33643.1 NADPH-dependent oxidoreductase [Xanthovirga aplysinae]